MSGSKVCRVRSKPSHARMPVASACERLIQKVPHGNWKTITFVAALRHDRVTAPFVLEGTMNGEMFKAYVEQFLAPTLKRDDVVFMDNVSVHSHANRNRHHHCRYCSGVRGVHRSAG